MSETPKVVPQEVGYKLGDTASVALQVRAQDPNPYNLDLKTLATETLVLDMLREETPIDSYNFQFTQYGFGEESDKRPIRVGAYRLEDDSPYVQLAKAVQGTYSGFKYRQSSEVTQTKAISTQENSFFILVADATHPEDVRAAASLRVTKLEQVSQSDTVTAYRKAFPGKRLPQAFRMTDIEKRRGLWEVSPVFSPDEYLVGKSTVLAYRALLRHAQAEGVSRMFCTLDADELGAVLEMGVNTDIIDRTSAAEDERQFFCIINVDPIKPVPEAMDDAMETWITTGEKRTFGGASATMWEKRHGILDAFTRHMKVATEGLDSKAVQASADRTTIARRHMNPALRPSRLEVVRLEPSYNVGIIAVMGTEFDSLLYHQALQLRADVYISEKGYLSDASRNNKGEESDEDDARSTHFAITEVSETPEGIKRSVIGTSRLIHKRDEDDLLPVEKYFDIEPAPIGSLEASRYIARHPNKEIQAMASLSLIRAMADESVRLGAEDHIYAVIERPLEVKFRWLGVPVTQLAPLTFLEDYNTENMAIVMNGQSALDGMQSKRPSEYARADQIIGSIG